MQNTLNPYQELMHKAAKDEVFREALIRNPKTTLEAHLSTTLPEGLAINVVENTPTELTLVIPPRMTDELEDEQLEAISGGGGGAVDAFGWSLFTVGVGCMVSAIKRGHC